MEEYVIQTINGKREYCRGKSNQLIQLSSMLEEKYFVNGKHLKCAICPSGTAAIHVAVMATVQQARQLKLPINIFYGDELYSQTPRIFKNLANLINLTLIPFNVTQTQGFLDLVEAHKDEFNIIFIESATNSSGDIFDYKCMIGLKKRIKHLKFIVDNTWLTSVIFNPFVFKADFVVLSLTKYYSGGSHIGGAVIGAKVGHIKKLLAAQGYHVSPKACEIMSQALTSLEARIQQTSETTKKVAAYLGDKVIVRHCSLETDRSHALSNIYYKGSYVPGVMSLIVNFNKDDAIKWMNSMNFEYETSYGGPKTRFDSHPKDISDTQTRCRLSIGYADSVDRIIEEFDKVGFGNK